MLVDPSAKGKELTEDMGHDALERRTVLGVRQAARKVSGLDERTVDGFTTVDRRYRAGFRAGEFDEKVCHY